MSFKSTAARPASFFSTVSVNHPFPWLLLCALAFPSSGHAFTVKLRNRVTGHSTVNRAMNISSNRYPILEFTCKTNSTGTTWSAQLMAKQRPSVGLRMNGDDYNCETLRYDSEVKLKS